MPSRPFVTVNFALTWDGRITTRNHTPADFPSRRDKRRLLEIRATGDALLVGAGTLKADNMRMGLPAEDLRAERVSRGKPAYPLRVILTNSGRLDPGLRVFEKALAPILVFSTEAMPLSVRQGLAGKAELHLENSPTVDLAGMLKTLRRRYGVRRLVCEGGPGVFRSLLERELIDEVHLTLCPRIFGGELAPAITGRAGTFLGSSVQLALRKTEVVDGECFLRYRVLRRRD